MQNKISRLFKNSLSSLIENFFNENIPAEIILKLNVLTLDLGSIAYNNLENEIADKLMESLLNAFPHSIRYSSLPNQPVSGYSSEPSVTGYLKLLEYFLLTGFFPWWASVKSLIHLQTQLTGLFDNEAKQLHHILMSAGQAENVRKRLAYQFTESFIHKIVYLLEPADAQFILNYHVSVRKLDRQVPVIKSGSADFDRELWFFILTFLIKEKGSVFSRKEFIKNSFEKIAAHFSIGYQVLLQLFEQALNSNILFEEQAEMGRLIRLISLEYNASLISEGLTSGNSVTGINNLIAPEEKIQWLRNFFERGSLPPRTPIQTITQMRALWVEMINKAPGDLKDLISHFTGDIIVERIFLFGDKETAEALVQLFQPLKAREILFLVNALGDSVRELLNRNYLNSEQPIITILINHLLVTTHFSAAAFLQHAVEVLGKIVGWKSFFLTDFILKKNRTENSFTETLRSLKPSEKGITIIYQPAAKGGYAIDETNAAFELPVFQSQSLASLLQYFISTGMLPWWGHHTITSVEQALEELYASSPLKAVELLQWAGTEKNFRERVLLQFPMRILSTIMSSFAAGNAAIAAFQQVIEFLKTSGYSHDGITPSVEINIIKIIWEQLINESYKTFDENLFFLQAAAAVSRQFNIPPRNIVLPLTALVMGEGNADFNEIFYDTRDDDINKHSAIETLSFAALTKVVELYISFQNNENKNLLADVPQQMITALQENLEYFFENHSFPPVLKKSPGFSSLVFLKSALLALDDLRKDLLSSLLTRHFQRPGLSALLTRLFSIDNKHDRSILLLLNKLDYQAERNVAIIAGNIPTQEKIGSPAPVQYDAEITLPLLFEYYPFLTEHTAENLLREANKLVDYFLTWNDLPASAKTLTKSSKTGIIKEAVFYLFDHDRLLLTSLLQKEIHLPYARLLLFGLFQTGRGGKEGLVTSFFKPYLKDAVLDYLWDTDMNNLNKDFYDQQLLQPAIVKGIIDEHGANEISDYRNLLIKPGHEKLIRNKSGEFYGSQLIPEFVTTLDHGDDVMIKKAANLLDYFLSYGKLPDGYRFPSSGLNRFILAIARFVSRDNTDLLKSILNKETHAVDARIQFHEWLFSGGSSLDKELITITNQFLPKDILLYFKKHTGTILTVTIKELVDNVIALPDSSQVKTFLQSAVLYPVITEYIVRQYNTPQFTSFLEMVNLPWNKNLQEISQQMEAFIYPVLSGNYEQQMLNSLMKEFNLLIISGRITVKDKFDFVSRFFDWLDSRRPVFIPNLYEYLYRSLVQNDELPFLAVVAFKKHVHKEIILRRVHVSKGGYDKKTKDPAPSKIKELIKQNVPGPLPVMEAKKEVKVKDKSVDSHINKGTKLYVMNAGLVLLHPFINTYFTLTELTHEGKFINEAAQCRAVHLLQYMVYGNTGHEEHVLVLNKILCGLNLEEPVPQGIIITDKEKAVTFELFKMLFQRWEKLKNSSVEGFRSSFLQREGALVKDDDGWTMQVEQRGYDLLLQTLPWAFGIIKLPWMPQVLQVHWM